MNSNDFVLRFPEGLPGVDEGKAFQLTPVDPGGPFFELKCVDNESVSLILTDPRPFFPDYQVRLSVGELGGIELSDEKNAMILLVTVIADDITDITVNLLAPIVVNMEKGLGKQVILNDAEYSLRHPLFAASKNGREELSC